MKILFLDFECTDSVNKKGKRDPSPYLANSIVSYGYKFCNKLGYAFLYHHEFKDDAKENSDKLQALLDDTELLVAFNAKFELQWLLESGYKYKGKLYDPMVTEYILARGKKLPLDLDSCCERRGAKRKLGDLVSGYWDKGLGFHQIPMHIVEEYGIGDVESLEDLYYKQQIVLSLAENQGLLKTIDMSNEFILCLVEMEKNGIHIDTDALEEVKQEFTKEYKTIESRLQQLANSVMGDTRTNLNSPEQLSNLLYSRKVNDKHVWKKLFNIGTDANGKRRRPPRIDASTFIKIIKENTTVLKRTIATECDCERVRFQKDSGINAVGPLLFLDDLLSNRASANKRPKKKQPKCKNCGGSGYTLVDSGVTAGFRLAPSSVRDTAAGGFATDKDTLNVLIGRCDVSKAIGRAAREFIELLIKYSAIGTYLSTFVGGIERGVNSKSILHYKLMQCITATGRLSSQDPNFQNMPRAKTFPVRKVVTSRFPDGKIIEVDFAQLEFRIAAFLAQDAQAIKDILENVDIHIFSRDTLIANGQIVDRQGAKEHTFKPLYGGSSGTKAEQAYYEAFKARYPGIAKWQQENINKALKNKPVTIPSGREYLFPGTRRTPSGYVINTTQICNYPVQGFATADVVPVLVIELLRRMVNETLRTRLILTVHDSVVLDSPFDEVEQTVLAINSVFSNLIDSLRRRYGIDVNVPLGWEIKIGDNWFSMKGT